jgi:hypothetical protein
MIADEAISAGKVSKIEKESNVPPAKVVTINIVEGNNKGLEVKVPKGCCRAVGRSLDDTESTRIFDAGPVLTLDDSTKKLVLSYVTQQFSADQITSPESAQGVGEEIGSFRRLPDLSLSDSATSRLHAMLFHGPNGVGVLDLVSKNGTFVNGVEVESKFLKEGDVITIGGSKLRIGKIE